MALKIQPKQRPLFKPNSVGGVYGRNVSKKESWISPSFLTRPDAYYNFYRVNNQTSGYGSVTPQTPWGRVITIVYALIGIPLMLLYLSTMGETLAKNFRRIYSRMCSPGNRDDRDDGGGRGRHGGGKRTPPNTVSSNHVGGGDYYRHRYEFETVSGAAAYSDTAAASVSSSGGGQKRVPVLLSLSVVAAYVALGAFIYQKLERWTLLEGSYFCFTSLGTIGFGELVPGGVESTKDVSVFVSSGYILVGMAVVAMCFQLLQDELAAMSRNCRWCCCWWWMWSQQQQHHQQHQQHKDGNMVVCTVAGTVDGGGGGCDDDDCGGGGGSISSTHRGRQPHNHNNSVAAGS
ncbi:hypothetical protein AGLY_006565 [Aphis glycines]|uniref:Potassium channel domain-containing protein n=1 Tax=Aphis glycines TaxID=307491 RepID=A0A6G0TRZ4_APHGL|nr:hypothetical protein AGLY_006565 [Aphis glycines]